MWSGQVWKLKTLLRWREWEFWRVQTHPNITKVNWLEYQTVTKLVMKEFSFFLFTEGLLDPAISKYKAISTQTKVSRIMYKDMTNSDKYQMATITDNITDYYQHFLNPCGLTDVTKLHNFQFRLLHNKIFCNNILLHWCNKLCSFLDLVLDMMICIFGTLYAA